ncbi:MacB-like core domain-containing protein [Reichenbachiella faecimaris]|uniref:MacB-like core domain-containing protein n=1 Tax=Reichenbachiella faecimaris TaxID=692418 RepID=A0A1W2GNG3_REIFA|nr:ABC transporter permease [Reichenbachiella faecimaris]SMD38209.1 MacB-like core domain-containing protein [Reichenbachiella faecimaris]
MEPLDPDYQPPKWAYRIFKWYCRSDRFEELSGDLEEVYQIRRENGSKWRANVQYCWNVLRCCKSYARKTDYKMDTSGALIKSFFKLSLRHIAKNKGYVALNVFGLGFALAFCIVSYMIYGFNREFDSVYTGENIYRVHAMRPGVEGLDRWEMSSLALEEVLVNDHSGVKHAVSYLAANISIGKGKYYIPSALSFASPSFLKVFDLPLKYGSKENFDLHGIYLTEAYAAKLFGDEMPVGKRLSVYYYGRKFPDVHVLGVFEKIPNNSSFAFEGLLNIETLLTYFELDRSDWEMHSFQFGQYVQLTSSDQKVPVEDFMEQYLAPHNEANPNKKIERFELTPLHNPIAETTISYGNMPVETNEFLIFCTMAVLILIVACFNLANTNVALISSRVKEIGVRKTIGSSSRMIFVQFIFETLIIMILAFVFSLSLINIISEEFLSIRNQQFLLTDLDMTGVLTFVFLFMLAVTIITGLVPALYAHKFKPVTILNHRLTAKGFGLTHYVLAIFQYSLSIAILLAGLTFMQNADFLKEQDYGYDTENLMIIRVKDGNEYAQLKTALDEKLFTKETFGSYHYLVGYSHEANIKIDELATEVNNYKVAGAFLNKMGVTFAEGRDFRESSQQDISDHVIVNQYFAEQYFVGGEALNKKITVDGEDKTVIGVINNFRDDELYSDYEPTLLIFTAVPEIEKDHFFLRTNGEPHHEVYAQVEEVWAELFERPMVYHWQHDYAYSSMIEGSEQLANIFMWLSIIAFVLSIVSIMAMASLHVNRRTKEICIRKVLGANASQILSFVNRPFIKILGAAFMLGILMGYFLPDAILSTIYLNYIEISWIQSVLIGLGIVSFALFVVYITVMRPVRANPTEGLRSE